MKKRTRKTPAKKPLKKKRARPCTVVVYDAKRKRAVYPAGYRCGTCGARALAGKLKHVYDCPDEPWNKRHWTAYKAAYDSAGKWEEKQRQRCREKWQRNI